MLVKECMTKNVEVGNPHMTLKEAAIKMREGDFGSLPIGEHDRLVGMLTDRDIVTRAVAEGRNPETTKVREIMSERVLYCFDDQTVEDVAQNMGENKVRRMLVLSKDKRLVGILSLGNLANADHDPLEIESALTRITRPITEANFYV